MSSNSSKEDTTSLSWTERWSRFQDDQRLERLGACRQLEGLLERCRHAKTNSATEIEEVSIGLRMMKYFGWRGLLQKVGKDGQPLVDSCAREQHAVWACRAVATGCGKELSYLKRCFDQEGPIDILLHSQTSYESSPTSTNGNVPCESLQQEMGACVTKGAQELYQRRREDE